ncbi:MAG TPA: chromosome segregation protein SMC, partial [Puia sp.]|nr:chromosome segregation protein SMC [Puia sp.]
IKGLEESVQFTESQVAEEDVKLEHVLRNLELLRDKTELARTSFSGIKLLLDQLRSEHAQAQRKQFDSEKNIAVADTSIQNLERALRQQEEESAVRAQQIKQLGFEGELTSEELESKRTDLRQLQEHQERTREQILQTQEKLEILRQELAEESRKYDAKKNEHDLLKSLIDSMEGYPESVKFLHKNPDWNHTSPVLSDIIYVKEEFRTAVENVLEPYLNYYVVNDLEEGLKAVHLLDDNKKGKANFFLLNKFPSDLAESHQQPADTVPALSVIEVEAKYLPLAKHLLQHVFIAENEPSIEWFNNESNGSVILEKHGKYVKGKYSLTGGSVGLFEGKKIGRAKNLEKISQDVIAHERIVAGLKTEIQSRHNEVIGFNEQLKEQALRQVQEDINRLNNQLFSIQNKTENLNGLQEAAVRRIGDLRNQLQHTQESIAGTRSEAAKLMEELNELKEKISRGQDQFTAEEQAFNGALADFNEVNLQMIQQQNRIAALNQEREFRNKQLVDLKIQIEDNRFQLEQATQQITESTESLHLLETALTEMIRNKDTEEKKLNEADQAYYLERNKLSEKETELRHLIRQKENAEHILGEIKDRLNDLKLQLAGMKERLSVEFRINLDDIIDEARTGELSAEELQEKADRMKKRLENLGEVNPTAVEAFQEMKRRYDFIVEQKNDLVNAKDTLLQTIQEVESTANQQFLETFGKVRENFQKVFKALFTEEDTADLVLENPENLAETGIDIVAKPKGKRPSSIQQLSGGEKTLTATALLFAIYLIKPAPFCILDEVDAPLDDANVGKFTNMIRQFSDNSQFIIVTHNKMTMSSVDVIYGVTMQEAGVSKLVPVDFRSLTAQTT